MARHTMMRPVRYALVAALLGALLVTTAGRTSAVAAMILAPGIAPTAGTAVVAGPDTFSIPFATTALALDVDCGAPAADCSLWVARNNGTQATEALFANQTGSRTNIPVTFINDGCFNFRLYDSAHALRYIQINIGHGAVCKTDGTSQAQVLFTGTSDANFTGSSLIIKAPMGTSGPVDWDSGFVGGVEDSQIWITRSQRTYAPPGGPAPGIFFTDCAAIPLPNGKEMLYAENVSGEKSDLALLGGGPYCLTLYSGAAHTTRIAGPTMVTIDLYLIYRSGTVYYNGINGATNALVCVYGAAIPGSSAANPAPFTYNSEGYGSAAASFQGAGAGTITYTLRTGVSGLVNGAPTQASCTTGTARQSFPVTT